MSFENADKFENWAYTYLLLENKKSAKKLENKLFTDLNEKENNNYEVFPHVQNIADIHLNSKKDREIEPNGDLFLVKILLISALIVLIVAMINLIDESLLPHL